MTIQPVDLNFYKKLSKYQHQKVKKKPKSLKNFGDEALRSLSNGLSDLLSLDLIGFEHVCTLLKIS